MTDDSKLNVLLGAFTYAGMYITPICLTRVWIGDHVN